MSNRRHKESCNRTKRLIAGSYWPVDLIYNRRELLPVLSPPFRNDKCETQNTPYSCEYHFCRCFVDLPLKSAERNGNC